MAKNGTNSAALDREVGHQAWGMLLLAHARLVRDIDEAVAAQGLLPMDWYDVLLALYHAPDRRLRLSDLADRIVFSRSGLTRLIDRLEAKKLLRRERCAEDRRGAFAVLTDAGREAMKKTWPAYEREIQSRFIDHLSSAEAAAMRAGLARVLAAAGVAGPTLPGEESPLVQVTIRSGSKAPGRAGR